MVATADWPSGLRDMREEVVRGRKSRVRKVGRWVDAIFVVIVVERRRRVRGMIARITVVVCGR